MAAVAYPQQWDWPELPAPVRLRPVTRPRRRRPSLRPASRRAVYRRRRLAVLMLAVAVVPAGRAAQALLGGGPLTAPGRAPGSAATLVYVVQPGDTLWGIAERIRPGADERPVVAALAAEVGGADPVPGQALTLP